MERPMTSWPCSASRAAATDESTPPDIATTIRMLFDLTSGWPRKHEGHEVSRRCFLYSTCFVCLRVLRVFVACLPCQSTKFLDQPRQDLDDSIDVFLRREHAEAEAERILRPVRREAHRTQDM